MINNEQVNLPVEILKPSIARTKAQKCKHAKNNKIYSLSGKGSFQYVERNQLPRHAIILGRRFLLPIKQPGTDSERYQARFRVRGHDDKEKEFIMHISKTVRHRNIKIFISIAVLYELKLWNKDVNKASIQANNLERDVYVIPDQRFGLSVST